MVEDCREMRSAVGQVALEVGKATQIGESARVECEVVALFSSV